LGKEGEMTDRMLDLLYAYCYEKEMRQVELSTSPFHDWEIEEKNLTTSHDESVALLKGLSFFGEKDRKHQ
jgi:hypothetical protein